ncbi:putative Agenet-like domain-containing protein [Dioscorea sansibarensis]
MGKSSALKRKQSKTKAFSVGDEVEVQSEDEGFRGAWYEATVVRPLLRHRRHSVVYTSLLEDSVSCRPLHEYVLDSHLRPRHPRRPGPPFQIHQVVDAFHQDGWWPGVVADVRGGRYAVYFPSTREEEEFVESDVRAHLRWVKGQWINDSEGSPGRTKEKFSVRDQVEVTRDKDIFGAAWYSGTIVKVIGKTYFLIEYTSLLQGSGCGGHCEFLREIVDAQYIRPFPHKPEAVKFDLFDEVEAFWTNYWLPGVITKVLSESMYVVKPTYQKKELELNAIDLRHNYNWTNGQWVRATQGESKKTEVGTGTKLSSYRKPKARKMPDFPGPVSKTADGEVTLDTCSDTGILKQENNRKLRLDDQLQPCRDSRKKELAKDNTKLVDLLPKERRSKISEKIGMTLDSPREVAISPSLTNEHPHSEGLCRERRGESSSVVSKLPPTLSVDILPEQGMSVSKDTVKASSLEPETNNSKDDMSENKTKALNLILSPSIQENNEFFSSGEWESYCCVSDVGLNLKKRRKKLVVRAPKRQKKIPNVVHTAPPGFVGKRGRPRKEGMQVKQVETTADQAVEIDCRKEEAGLSGQDPSVNFSDAVQLQCYKNGAKQAESSPLDLNHAIAGDLQGESITIIHESKDQERRFDGYNQLHDKHVTSQFNSSSTVEKSVDDLSTKQAAVAMVSSPNRAAEEMCNDGNETSINEDNQALPPLEEVSATVQEGLVHNLPSSNKTEIQAVSAENLSDSSEKNALVPFVRSSPMWQTIESMEIFRLLPQEPHFQPLERHCPEFREGMAVGLMITFANFATSIRSLHITDPLMVLNEKLKALATLEANGFEVQCMRHRIEQLLDIKRKQDQSEIKRTALEGQLFDRRNEKGQLSLSIMDFDKAIMELEQKIGCFKEKRSSAIVQRELIDSEIAILQRDVEATEEFLASAEHQFDAAVAAPW